MLQRGMTLTFLMMLMVLSIGALGSSETTTGHAQEKIEKLKTTLTGLQEKIAALEAKEAKRAEKIQFPAKGEKNRRTPGRKLEEEAAPTPIKDVIAGLVTCLDYMWLLVSEA